MKYLKLFENQESAVNKTITTPSVTMLQNNSYKVLCVPQSEDEVRYVSDGDFIKAKGKSYIELSATGDGQIIINKEYANTDGIEILGNKLSRVDSTNDRTINDIKYYAYEFNGTFYYITIDLSDYDEDDILESVTFYYDEEDECDGSFNDGPITICKYDPTYDGPIQEILNYTAGENQKIQGDSFDIFSVSKGYGEDNLTLTSIVIPDGVTSIGGYAFMLCESLTSVVIPDGVTSIGDYAFMGCRALTSIVIPDGVTSIGEDAFEYCSFTSVNIPNSVTNIAQDAFMECESLTSVVIPDGVTSISNCTFQGCISLTSVVIPDGVTSIGDYAFNRCTALSSVNIPNSVTSIGEKAFAYCSFTSIVIPNSVTSIGKAAFWECSALTSVEIPNSVTSIGKEAFQYCYALTTVNIPDSITSIGTQAFYYCTALTSIIYNGTTDQWYAITKGESWHTKVPSTAKVTCTDGVVSLG